MSDTDLSVVYRDKERNLDLFAQIYASLFLLCQHFGHRFCGTPSESVRLAPKQGKTDFLIQKLSIKVGD